MSLVITMYTREGIVMAADSRATLNMVRQEREGQTVHINVIQSDTVRKLFLFESRIGISTFGEAAINGVPISGYVDTFLSGLKPRMDVNGLASELLKFFALFEPNPKAGFHVAGYEKGEQLVMQVLVDKKEIKRVNPPGTQGAAWAGESDILTRLLQPLYEKRKEQFIQLPYFQIPWGFFTLQDAIEFVRFAIRTTADSMRFMPRPKTVGGPIDVIAITPEEGIWINKKDLK